ncbi:translation initiation factor eIF-2 alpha subunit [Hokovirus HKV1]|uniref:Translation initiation factor eIF-2 alpha subunit n=1 Tax=Hokovirus HKV1 TaxID=1977638 RepID=A0A1V0SGQ4_9VIRU|nr:translation initiation factor eIF-2 alpha subunit [Hokovirus HKV1]
MFYETNIRYYKEKYPQINDIIMAKIEELTDTGANLKFPEYCNCSGFVTEYELYFRKNKRIQKVKINDLIPMIVLSVDTDKNFILVSRRRVREEEEKTFREKFRYVTNINKICNELTFLHKKYYNTEENNKILRNNIFNFCEKYKDNITDNNNLYKNMYLEMLSNIDKIIIDSEPKFIDYVLDSFNNRIIHKKNSLETSFDLTCFDNSPMNNIKLILKQILVLDDLKIPYNTVVNSPTYKLILNDCLDKDIDNYNNIINSIIDNMQNLCDNTNSKLIVLQKNKIISSNNDNIIEFKFLPTDNFTK